MTTRRRIDPNRAAPVEVRLLFPTDAYEDLKAIAKVSGLAVTQYVRALVLNHVAKIYANTENNR